MNDKKYDDKDLKRVAGIVAEQINDRIDLLEENMGAMFVKKMKPIVQEELIEVKSDIKVIKAAVVHTSNDLHKLEKRVAHLEAA